MTAAPVVLVVDDDVAVRTSLVRLLGLHGYGVRAFPSAELLLAALDGAVGDCVIADLRMEGRSGLALQAELTRRGSTLPVVFLTGHGDVDSCVAAMKGGAVDFLQKPVREEVLVSAVAAALARRAAASAARTARHRAQARLARLTPRERDVIADLVAGRSGPETAARLGIAPQTVRVHRMRAMTKLGVQRLPDVVTLWRQAEAEH